MRISALAYSRYFLGKLEKEETKLGIGKVMQSVERAGENFLQNDLMTEITSSCSGKGAKIRSGPL